MGTIITDYNDKYRLMQDFKDKIYDYWKKNNYMISELDRSNPWNDKRYRFYIESGLYIDILKNSNPEHRTNILWIISLSRELECNITNNNDISILYKEDEQTCYLCRDLNHQIIGHGRRHIQDYVKDHFKNNKPEKYIDIFNKPFKKVNTPYLKTLNILDNNISNVIDELRYIVNELIDIKEYLRSKYND